MRREMGCSDFGRYAPGSFEVFNQIRSHPVVFFSHNKPANSIFSHNGPVRQAVFLAYKPAVADLL
jgi:hypothetical protein